MRDAIAVATLDPGFGERVEVVPVEAVILRCAIFVAVVANFLTLIWIVRKVSDVAAEWRRQHEQREPLASALGMMEMLIAQNVRLEFEQRMRIYLLVRSKLAAAIKAMDAGAVIRQRVEVLTTDSALRQAEAERDRDGGSRTAAHPPAAPADAPVQH